MVFCHILYCFVAKSVLFGFTLFCRKIVLSQFTRYCVEEILAKNCARGEKMTNMRYGSAPSLTALSSLRFRDFAQSKRNVRTFVSEALHTKSEMEE